MTADIDKAYRHCHELARRHYENFPIASLLIPKNKRKYFFALYAFMRTADDFADNATLPVEQRLHLLMQWQRRLDACYEGTADEPIFIALRATVDDLQLPKAHLDALLNAFKVDLFKNRYRTFDELLEYCSMSANPVGRLVMHVLGYAGHPKFKIMTEASDAICTGLQLANHWQDLFIDLEKDRLYLPMEDMQRFGYSVDNWKQKLMNDAYFRLMAFQIDRSDFFFQKGKTLFQHLNFPERLEIKLIWLGGQRILRKQRAVKYDMVHRRPEINWFDKFWMLSQLVRPRL
ncbi:squalene synthase HpnC [bacterium]|nr:squalene synthase HpnC [bacterium]